MGFMDGVVMRQYLESQILSFEVRGWLCSWMDAFGTIVRCMVRFRLRIEHFGEKNWKETRLEIRSWVRILKSWTGKFCGFGSTSFENQN